MTACIGDMIQSSARFTNTQTPPHQSVHILFGLAGGHSFKLSGTQIKHVSHMSTNFHQYPYTMSKNGITLKLFPLFKRILYAHY